MKMIIAVDIETYVKEGNKYKAVLDSRKFLRGCIAYENGKTELFNTKEEMWKKILDLAKKCEQQKGVLRVYGHYHEYDFYGYANWKDKNLIYKNNRPFIVSYKNPETNKEIITFHDSMSIYRGSLKKLGELIGLQKGELPMEIEEWELYKMEAYLRRDAEIVIKAIQKAKEFLKKEQIHIKGLYTINQIAIAYIIKKLKETQRINNVKSTKYQGRIIKQTNIFHDLDIGRIWETKNKEEIHNAYKGGRVQAWTTGTITGVTSIDINSLYPYELMNMRFPNLKTEQKIMQPMKGNSKEFLEYIGISKVMMKNKTDEYGLLAIRTETNSYVCKKGQVMIGTWTNEEIKTAILNGYELLDCEYTIRYQDDQNPFKIIVKNLFEYKKEATTEVEKMFYKGILNGSIGKFGQKTKGKEIIIDSVEKTEEYLQKGYKMIRGLDYDIMYRRDEKEIEYKKYYCPIIPTLVNANARIRLYKALKQIPLKDLVYCDTDSIKFKGKHINKFKIGKEIGEWKIENENDVMICYGNKTYLIGDEIKLSGFHKKGITREDFMRGIVSNNKMVTINTTTNEDEVGMQKEVIRDLNEQLEEHKKSIELMDKQRIHIDSNLDNIDYFLKKIELINI